MAIIDEYSPRSGRFMADNSTVRNIIDKGVPQIDIVLERISRKEYFDVQKVYAEVANAGKVRFDLAAGDTDMHVIVITDAEGKARFRSYIDTTFSAPGTELPPFNRYIDDAPAPAGKVYEDPTVNVLGTQRFDKLILGGSGPQSTGATSGPRVESVISAGHSVYVEIENISGQAKDIGVTIEWYEPNGTSA